MPTTAVCRAHLLGERLTVDRSTRDALLTFISLDSPPRFFLARSLALFIADRCTGTARRGAATSQCLECGGITHARRVPYSEQTNSRIRYVPRRRPHDRLRGLNRDLRPAVSARVYFSLSHSSSSSRSLPLVFFFLSSCVAKIPKFLMRSVRRHRSPVALPETPALPYLTRSCCSPTINLVRRIPRYARNSEQLSLSSSLPRSLSLSD